MAEDLKDSIDFGHENVRRLFRRMLIPTVTSTVFAAVLTITDGIFVGKGLGSDALAAVNIVAPLWLIATGVGLMFGMGASVVASIHLSRGKQKTARINMTQSIVVSSLLLMLFSAIVLCDTHTWVGWLGSTPQLKLLAVDYLVGFMPFAAVNALLCSGGFFIRLDGSPRYAMACSMVSAGLNILLDYLFIFIFNWGIFGAAIATSLGSVVGAVMILGYLANSNHKLHFIRIKASRKSMRLTMRNVGYMCRLGFPSFLGDAAVSCMMLCGNLVFVRLSGDDGVAAWSVICYFFPIVFMLYNAIGLSAQPIISFNFGAGLRHREKQALRLALYTTIGCGVLITVMTSLMSAQIASLFVDEGTGAYRMASKGLPIFSIGFVFFAVSMMSIVYFQSVKRDKSATLVTVMRGFAFMILCFFTLPRFWGVAGAWLAVPAAEILTVILVVAIYIKNNIHHNLPSSA